MPVKTPKIDDRDQQMIVEQVRELALYYCPEWEDVASIEADKNANALIHIFSRMMEIIAQRLNKVPDKNFLAFLDMVGVHLSPPRIAHAPLTFTIAKGGPQYVSIPAATQVAAPIKDKEPVVFETEKELTVISPKLTKAVSLSPGQDRWTDHSPVLFDSEKKGVEDLFKGRDLVPHRLCLGHKKLFSFEETATIVLTVTLKKNIEQKAPWEVKWYCYKDDSPDQVPLSVADNNDPVVNLLESGDITFSNLGGISKKTLKVSGNKEFENYWIFAELKKPIPKDTLPRIDTIKARVEITPISSAGTGTISSNNTSTSITGSGTAFTKELGISDSITAAGQTRSVTGISSNTKLTVNSAFKSGFNNKSFLYGSSLFLDKAFINNFPIDMTKDFYPFGEKPQFNDTFYIGSNEVFSKKGAIITVMVALSGEVDVPDTQNIKLLWEFYDGNRWMKLGETTNSKVDAARDTSSFTDSTFAFNNNGVVTFTCPNIKASQINGEENYWIRVRIIGGNYGEEATYEEKNATYNGTGTIESKETIVAGTSTAFTQKLSIGDSINAADQTKIITAISSDTELIIDSAFKSDLPSRTTYSYSKTLWVYKPATYKPPSIKTLTLAYAFNSPGENLDVVLAYNDFIYQDQTKAIQSGNKYFTPFLPVTDKQPALYLAFNQDIATLPVTIFFPLIEKVFTSYKQTQYGTEENPSLAWEYWTTKKKWSEMKIEDNTRNLTNSEMVQILIPADISKRPCFEFETEYYWIRARLAKGTYGDFPRLTTIHTNTVRAHNLVTVQNEVLGSSNGTPNQVFTFSRSPVLPEQKVLIREVSLIEEERQVIISDEGTDAIEEILDDSGNIVGFWVRWHEMDHFSFSKPNSRHYVIDRNKGTIMFGDGERGMIPLAGTDHIKCSYQSGGGVDGNVKAGTITKLRTSFPYIDSVTNPEDASGGGAEENLDRVKERGPQTLKHRDRAVTHEDFEWLVREASPNVAKVKCMPTQDPSLQFTPGWVTLIIVPESDDPKPLPTQQLISEIETYLFERTSTYLTVSPSQVNLIGPRYIQVGVQAGVTFTSIREAKTIEGRIIDNLTQFFHPLHGGPEKKGWDFGRNVYISKVYEVIENTDGVDYVYELCLNASVQIFRFTLEESIIPTVSYPEYSTIESVDGSVKFYLPQRLALHDETAVLDAMGFKEGDHVILGTGENSTTLVLTSVSHESFGDVLECEPILTDTAFPAGSTVGTSDKRVTSIILNEIPVGKISVLKVAILDVGDTIVLRHIDDPSSTESGEIQQVSTQVETIFIEDNYLVYPGTQAVYSDTNEICKNTEEELVFPYLFNTNSREIHNLNNKQTNCHIELIHGKNMKFARTLDDIGSYDYCRWCFGPEMSER